MRKLVLPALFTLGLIGLGLGLAAPMAASAAPVSTGAAGLSTAAVAGSLVEQAAVTCRRIRVCRVTPYGRRCRVERVCRRVW